MIINVSPAIAHMIPALTEYVELMGSKLLVNLHKDEVLEKDIPILLERLAGEVNEFKDEVVDGQEIGPNGLEELADMGNFCFLLYLHLRQRGVRNVTESFIEEFYDIDCGTGRVYCKKSRGGSPLKPGDEVRGTTRRGRVYIRAQHAASGATISLPRADLIWYAATGQWPLGKLRYTDPSYRSRAPIDHPITNDHFANLTLEPPPQAGKLPFVSQWKPKGRETHKNWGRWVYQRRHGFKLVRVGYYDGAEQAAEQGLKDWKVKTRA